MLKTAKALKLVLALMSGEADTQQTSTDNVHNGPVADQLGQKLLRPLQADGDRRIAAGAFLLNPVLGTLLYTGCKFYHSEQEIINNLSTTLRAGGDINYQEKSVDENGQEQQEFSSLYTALMYASYEGYPNVVQYLVEQGADVNLKDEEGWNAYQLAEYYRDDFQNRLLEDEMEPVTAEFPQEEKERIYHYNKEYAERYNRIVCYLKPITHDQAMPWSWYYEGSTKPDCQ